MTNISVLEQIDRAFTPLLDKSEKFKAMPFGEMLLVDRAAEEKLKKQEDSKATPQEANNSQNNDRSRKDIAFSFQDYLRTIKRIQIFQNTNDEEGYREWTKRRGQEGMRLFIALRKWGKKAQDASSEFSQSKYAELAQAEDNITAEQVKNLHQRIKCFDDMQPLLTRFSQVVRNQSKNTVQAVQLIWPEFKSIIDGEWSAELMLSRLEVPILKINDLKMQANIKHLLNAFFKRAEAISHRHLHSSPIITR